MKKQLLTIITAATISVTSSIALANNQGFNSIPYQGPGFQPINTVAAALQNAKDDQNVVFTGYIVAQESQERFLFKDPTGEIILDIDDEEWGYIQQTITPTTELTIYGEFERGFASAIVEVDRINING